jgi:isopentenyldiphosphate isomerase
MTEELVAIVDETGAVVGSAPRSQMRARNLPHLIIAVLVRDSTGRVYVHRRSDIKDVFPGLHDCFTAGCVAYGEDPADSARRELAEELGITGVEIVPLSLEWYRDDSTWHLCHVFQATYDGTVVHQESEIASGGWMTVAELRARLADPDWTMVPDGRWLVEQLLADGRLA